MGFTVDAFVKQFDPPFPTHIKIDVDGIEDKIIQGAPETLRDSRLQSLLIELDAGREDYTGTIIQQLEDAGLFLAERDHAEDFHDEASALVFNHIFCRK